MRRVGFLPSNKPFDPRDPTLESPELWRGKQEVARWITTRLLAHQSAGAAFVSSTGESLADKEARQNQAAELASSRISREGPLSGGRDWAGLTAPGAPAEDVDNLQATSVEQVQVDSLIRQVEAALTQIYDTVSYDFGDISYYMDAHLVAAEPAVEPGIGGEPVKPAGAAGVRVVSSHDDHVRTYKLNRKRFESEALNRWTLKEQVVDSSQRRDIRLRKKAREDLLAKLIREMGSEQIPSLSYAIVLSVRELGEHEGGGTVCPNPRQAWIEAQKVGPGDGDGIAANWEENSAAQILQGVERRRKISPSNAVTAGVQCGAFSCMGGAFEGATLGGAALHIPGAVVGGICGAVGGAFLGWKGGKYLSMQEGTDVRQRCQRIQVDHEETARVVAKLGRFVMHQSVEKLDQPNTLAVLIVLNEDRQFKFDFAERRAVVPTRLHDDHLENPLFAAPPGKKHLGEDRDEDKKRARRAEDAIRKKLYNGGSPFVALPLLRLSVSRGDRGNNVGKSYVAAWHLDDDDPLAKSTMYEVGDGFFPPRVTTRQRMQQFLRQHHDAATHDVNKLSAAEMLAFEDLRKLQQTATLGVLNLWTNLVGRRRLAFMRPEGGGGPRPVSSSAGEDDNQVVYVSQLLNEVPLFFWSWRDDAARHRMGTGRVSSCGAELALVKDSAGSAPAPFLFQGLDTSYEKVPGQADFRFREWAQGRLEKGGVFGGDKTFGESPQEMLGAAVGNPLMMLLKAAMLAHRRMAKREFDTRAGFEEEYRAPKGVVHATVPSWATGMNTSVPSFTRLYPHD